MDYDKAREAISQAIDPDNEEQAAPLRAALAFLAVDIALSLNQIALTLRSIDMDSGSR